MVLQCSLGCWYPSVQETQTWYNSSDMWLKSVHHNKKGGRLFSLYSIAIQVTVHSCIMFFFQLCRIQFKISELFLCESGLVTEISLPRRSSEIGPRQALVVRPHQPEGPLSQADRETFIVSSSTHVPWGWQGNPSAGLFTRATSNPVPSKP